ncbi:hypothetical protein M8C21_005036 [Ambrosia artemisiifolia]|uniref:Pectinesterase inhibitor domain-containing protein n=1 Tax=Ambrosia artemisiifolia TaxID=4212 RepID=A0AAD5C196_AMBAR|nr:hypothetical protein M8C21_005036 [Ambrosia artemisiifolia]
MASFNLFLSILLSVIMLLSLSTLSMQLNEETDGDINRWCQTTPHPNQCNYFLSRGPHRAPRHRSDFRLMALQAAIDNANEAQGCTKKLGKMCRTSATKAVWNDCYRLLNNTVFQLNQTVTGLKNNQSTNFDTQTWLSAALTNLQTCITGCNEMNLTDFAKPIATSNLTEMISNSLAINHQFLKQKPASNQTNDDFPTWFSRHDRRLLATVSLQSLANVTVSQVSGNRFMTIQSALDYAGSIDRQNKRFIIYIKAGVYKENIDIVNGLNNIMFVGDGIRYTIITGNRSAAGGSTTYGSATVVPAPDLIPVLGSVQTYLGRPWQQYSRTVFMKTYLDGFINPKGWLPWGNTDFAFTTLYYGEYGCFGNGSSVKNRVNWTGYHGDMSLDDAQQFTVSGLIAGRMWLPATGVPFISGL